MNDDDLFVFADEDAESVGELKPDGDEEWRILIVDDEPAVHDTTRRVLDDFTFESKRIHFFNAVSASEAIEILETEKNIALVLLDVVMEDDEAGLRVVKHIRENLSNMMTRVVLRTGQPGVAPEKEIIEEYDINDYKAKSELTAQKLFTTVLSSLRSYRDLKIIDRNRKGLKMIIESSGELYNKRSLKKFTEGVLCQLISILRLDNDSVIMNNGGFAATIDANGFVIHAATGKYQDYIGCSSDDVLSVEIKQIIKKSMEKNKSIFQDDHFVGYFASKIGSKHILYMGGCGNLSDVDKDIIMVFFGNVSVALDNINLNREIIETQKEVVFTLGEVVENRSKETANHVLRVGEYSYILAKKLGLSEDDAELIKMASPLHDVGKIGIPDSILLKPGRLTPEEYEAMKSHAEIGYEILNKSERPIIKAASVIAYEHHERWDGKGYPRGISGDRISLYGRITSLVDVFDALANDRCYRKAWELEKVLGLIREERGKQFDPELVDLFLGNLQEFIKVSEIYKDQ
ncbi:MAG: DUF3369 domain-containing protein [Gammaproteobacteria bacterium]|nr:MAG: DUF3369 domain-containing protein [Gammaproteobacteria bacterium]